MVNEIEFLPTMPVEEFERRLELLSPREIQVLALSWSDWGCTEIGDRLGISFRTVEAHRKNIVSKMSMSLVRVLWSLAHYRKMPLFHRLVYLAQSNFPTKQRNRDE